MGEVVAALTMLLDIHCVIINTHSKRSNHEKTYRC